jgi:hypothetical protein
MDPDNLRKTWQAQSSQTRLTIDTTFLLKEVQRNEQQFTAAIFWRDAREVGVTLLMMPVWVYLGVKHALPWTWYLMLPTLLWIAGFMLIDRMRRRRSDVFAQPLRQQVEYSLAQVEHQIWLLRNILWWYLLPFAGPMMAFLAQVAWQKRSGGWGIALNVAIVAAMAAITFASIYWLNRHAVRSRLEPRRQELEAMLISLSDDSPAAT